MPREVPTRVGKNKSIQLFYFSRSNADLGKVERKWTEGGLEEDRRNVIGGSVMDKLRIHHPSCGLLCRFTGVCTLGYNTHRTLRRYKSVTLQIVTNKKTHICLRMLSEG